MARNILLLSQLKNSSTSQVGFFGSLFLCAFALFMCASHSRKWQKWKACYGYENQDPVIQLNPERIQANVFGDAGESSYSGEASLWQKNIIMGDKCQLPDFSGVIIYDTAGNLVLPAKTPPALPWK